MRPRRRRLGARRGGGAGRGRPFPRRSRGALLWEMPADGCDLRACRGGARAAASLRGSPLLGGEGAGAPSRAHRRCAARRRAWELPQPARAASAGCAPPGRAGGPPGPDRRHGRQRAALTPQMLCGAGRRPKKWSAPKKWGAPRLRAALWAVAGAFPLAFPGARETRFFGLRTQGSTKHSVSTLGCPRYPAAV